jgi:hypothetical protein
MSSTLLYKVIVGAVVLFPTLGAAQRAFVTCWDDLADQTNYRRHIAKTPVVTSDQGWEAYIEAEARPAKLESGNCVNTSRLMLRPPKGSFHPVYITRPSEYALGNHLEILGWSGGWLLFNDMTWQYASDSSSNQVVVLDAKSGIFEMPDLGKSVVERLHLQCQLDAISRRWDQNKVVFTVADTELGNEGEGCLEGQAKTWTYDPKTRAITPVAEKRVVEAGEPRR